MAKYRAYEGDTHIFEEILIEEGLKLSELDMEMIILGASHMISEEMEGLDSIEAEFGTRADVKVKITKKEYYIEDEYHMDNKLIINGKENR